MGILAECFIPQLSILSITAFKVLKSNMMKWFLDNEKKKLSFSFSAAGFLQSYMPFLI